MSIHLSHFSTRSSINSAPTSTETISRGSKDRWPPTRMHSTRKRQLPVCSEIHSTYFELYQFCASVPLNRFLGSQVQKVLRLGPSVLVSCRIFSFEKNVIVKCCLVFDIYKIEISLDQCMCSLVVVEHSSLMSLLSYIFKQCDYCLHFSDAVRIN